MKRTCIFIARARSMCCSTETEIWTVRAKSSNEAKRRIEKASGTVVYDVRYVSGNAWRHFKGK